MAGFASVTKPFSLFSSKLGDLAKQNTGGGSHRQKEVVGDPRFLVLKDEKVTKSHQAFERTPTE